MDERAHVGVQDPALPIDRHVADLRALVEELHDGAGADGGPGGPDGPDGFQTLQHLETAYEELRVAEEEVRVQQEQIVALLDGQRTMLWQHERALAALPVPVVVTDLDGIVLSVNTAAERLAAGTLRRPVGKPAAGLFVIEDRPALRTCLSAVRSGEPMGRCTAAVAVAPHRRTSVELSVTRSAGLEPRVTWLLLMAPDGGHDLLMAGLPTALAALAALPAGTASLRDLLTAAAQLCRTALGEDVDVSLTVGSPLEPEAAASTSRRAQALDGVQLHGDDGPSVRAHRDALTTWATSLATDDRWPGLRDHLRDLPDLAGDIGTIAVPLSTGTGSTSAGVLTVYLPPARVEPAVVEATELLGATVAAVLRELAARADLQALAGQMEQALASRAVIDQAKGIIMGDRGWDADRAFAHLVSLSSTNGLKVRDVAQALVDQMAGDKRR